MATVTYSRYELKDGSELVMVRYKDVLEEALAEGKTAAELVAAANEVIAEESGAEELPAVAEVKHLKTRVSKAGDKFVVLASVRYVSEASEESSN